MVQRKEASVGHRYALSHIALLGMQLLRRGCGGEGSRQLPHECALHLLRRHNLTAQIWPFEWLKPQ